ncbi:protein zer-1 homolog [Ctenocephalides felis]|uniref:protein zer-1 homolog n=1 Tax=Ctenocephalides felis TaxID=7515 RepID=UPI000E6E48EE|nr:protein zer-1 homolog [Ctenocephalides felis]
MSGVDFKYNTDPESLYDITLKYVVENIDILYEEYLNYDDKIDLRLRKDFSLPRELCERLIEYHNDYGYETNDKFAKLFTHLENTKLKHVTLRNSMMTDSGLQYILNHDLVSLQLSNCTKLTSQTLSNINLHSKNLTCLSFGNDTSIIPTCTAESNWLIFRTTGYVIQAPVLKKLTIRDINLKLSVLLSNLKNLTYLDLSQCHIRGEFTHLEKLKSLNCLILYNVDHLDEAIDTLCRLTSLQCLDLSQSSERANLYEDENQVLAKLIDCLPRLTHLDISGTNLAGTGVAMSSSNDCVSDIPGLSKRMRNPLEFLGLYGTLHSACQRHDIPAKVISGDHNERQILVAAQAYQERPDILTKVLNDLYHLLRFENCSEVLRALTAVLTAMDRHVSCKHIQISGSATLFYIVKGKEKTQIGLRMRQHIIRTLLNGMAKHLEDETMMRNGCLTLCQFKLPQDVLFQYEKLVKILLHGVSDSDQGGFVQRIAIYLLNSLACQVDNKQKQCLGDMGAISKMLWIIKNRILRHICDDVLEVAWSTMWNVTDETPANCLRFLEGDGMDHFIQCLIQFPFQEELLRNMMGLLGNVAEVKDIRHRLMTASFIKVFSDLLDSKSDGIEVSYNAAGVLSHLASDGQEAWAKAGLEKERDDVLQKMTKAIERWNLSAERNINYRSFEPIMRLVRCYDTPECQHWAVWALANLTLVYPTKYCDLFESEGGLVELERLIKDDRPYESVKQLAKRVLENCSVNKMYPDNPPARVEAMLLDG